MIPPTHLRQTIRKALKSRVLRARDTPAPDDAFHPPDARHLRDPDWVIREIVDDVMFETAR